MNVKLLRIINVILALNLLVMATTGGLRDWIPYDVFRAIHRPAGFTLVVLVLVHLYLNRNWIKQNYLKKKKGAK